MARMCKGDRAHAVEETPTMTKQMGRNVQEVETTRQEDTVRCQGQLKPPFQQLIKRQCIATDWNTISHVPVNGPHLKS